MPPAVPGRRRAVGRALLALLGAAGVGLLVVGTREGPPHEASSPTRESAPPAPPELRAATPAQPPAAAHPEATPPTPRAPDTSANESMTGTHTQHVRLTESQLAELRTTLDRVR